MPWEYALMAEGRAEAQKAQRRREAGWISIIVSAQVGKSISAAQLLGEETAEESEAKKRSEGERRIAEIQRMLKKRKKKRKADG